MIKIKFEANSVAELRSLITEYLGITTTAAPKAEKTVKEKPAKTSTEPPQPEIEAKPVEETPVSSIGLEDIRTLVLSGEIPKARVKGLLGNFGVERITEVPESDYAVFYEQLASLKGE